MKAPYESRFDRFADLVMGLLFTVVVHWHCERCGRTADHFTRSQHAEWKRGVSVECRRLMFGQRPCRGRLVRAVTS